MDEASPPMSRNPRGAAFNKASHQFVDLLGGLANDAPADRVAGIRMAHHQRRQSGVVRRRRAIHPGDRLEGSLSKRTMTSRVKLVASARPSPARRARRIACRPRSAPLPSSEIGNP
jgi:hypothetical protein